jgi:hypothetical protein
VVWADSGGLKINRTLKQRANPKTEMTPKRNFFMICSPEAKMLRRVRKLVDETHESRKFRDGNVFRDTIPRQFRIYLSIRRAMEMCTNFILK